MERLPKIAKFVEQIAVKEWFVLVILITLFTDLAIFLNIPFLRQILGLLFLTILPGLLIIQTLKLNKIGFTEKFVLAIGLSISFLMLFGLLLNNSLLSIGYKTPLATVPLLISFNTAIIALAIIGYRLNKNKIFSLPNLNLSTSEKAFLIVPISFPALSIFGMHVMNTTDNNIILMLLLFLIPIYVIFVCFFNHKFPKRLYPIAIFLISISLLLLMVLRSNHIIGVDTHVEYYYFQTTLTNLYWSAFGHSTLDACLAISLLPTIYQSILNVDAEFLFKILYSLLFSISPLVIYVLSKRYVGELYGFLTACSFMTLSNFLCTTVHARTNTAILFFALAMMVLFSDKIDPLKKRILFIVFMASCMVSHYSTTYIFFFIMLGTFIGVEMLSKKYTVKKVVSLTITILFFAFIFFWYSQVTEAAFNSGVSFVENTLSNLNKFFVEEMRSGTTRSVLGEGIMQKGIPHKIEFVFAWLTFAFIGIGIITLIRRYKEMSFPELNFRKADFLRGKFEVGYFMAAIVCSGLLVAVVALPYISTGYGMDRAHLLGICILSVFFVIGGIIVAKHLDKLLSKKKIVKNKREVRAYLIILLVLIPYFLSTTGVTYQMFGVPQEITLSSEGKTYDMMYVHDEEGFGARWLRGNTNEKARIYTDYFGGLWLSSQGMVRSSIYDRSFIEDKEAIGDGYIFLRYVNVVEGKLLGREAGAAVQWHNLTEYDHLFVERNKIYDNYGSQVWR
jgi:uncharacterized membrane protein